MSTVRDMVSAIQKRMLAGYDAPQLAAEDLVQATALLRVDGRHRIGGVMGSMWKELLFEKRPSSLIADSGGRRESASTVAVAEPQAKQVGEIVSRPVPVTAPTLPDEYEAIAERIGAGHLVARVKQAREADAAAVRREELRVRTLNVLSELGLRMYDEHSVAAYLKTVYGTTPFGWRALRDQDNRLFDGYREGFYFDASQKQWMSAFLGVRVDTASPMHIIGSWDTALYSKPVPMPVLLTIENIQTRIPEARFFVSDEAQPIQRPLDPFLMVLVGEYRYIVERWDEPKFRP